MIHSFFTIRMQYPEGHVSKSIYATFRLVSRSSTSGDLLGEFLPNLSLAIWTTTPWTIPANAGKRLTVTLFSFSFLGGLSFLLLTVIDNPITIRRQTWLIFSFLLATQIVLFLSSMTIYLYLRATYSPKSANVIVVIDVISHEVYCNKFFFYRYPLLSVVLTCAIGSKHFLPGLICI